MSGMQYIRGYEMKKVVNIKAYIYQDRKDGTVSFQIADASFSLDWRQDKYGEIELEEPVDIELGEDDIDALVEEIDWALFYDADEEEEAAA